jgi:hypothetical protein
MKTVMLVLSGDRLHKPSEETDCYRCGKRISKTDRRMEFASIHSLPEENMKGLSMIELSWNTFCHFCADILKVSVKKI